MRRTVTQELPGWIGEVDLHGNDGMWMEVHTLTGSFKIPFTPPEGTRGAVITGGEQPNVVVSVSITMDFIE